MMAPFDNSMSSQQQQGVSQQPLPRPPIPPGHQSTPSSGMHQQGMNTAYPHGMHRNVSGGLPPGGQPYQIPPTQSPGSRHGSFTMVPGGGPQGQYSSHPPLHSPANQQQAGQIHPNVTQLHRASSQSRPGHIGMPSMQQSHDSMMTSSSSGRSQQYMGTSMDNSINNNQMMSMGNSMNVNMGNSFNGSLPNIGGNTNSAMGNNSMNNLGNSGTSSIGNPSNSMMSNSMNNNSGRSGGWQTDRDTQHRRDMIQHIVKMLKKDKNGSPEWLSKLPQMAKQLEVSLYRNARSFEAYMDMNTLKQRLQQIAAEVSRKARDQRDDRQGTSAGPNSNLMGMQSSRGQISSLDGVNPRTNNNSAGMNVGNVRGNVGSHMSMMGNSGFQDQRSMANNNLGGSNQQSVGMISSGSKASRNDPEWKIRIRHKQQRLLLLHHSAKCPHEDGRCPVTPHCADMKRLWKHMEGCKDNQCRIPHCFSSRAILSHYRKCKDASCPACGPVRETVRRSQTRNNSNQNRSLSTKIPEPNRMVSSASNSSQNISSPHGNTFSFPAQSSTPSMPPASGGAVSSQGMQYPSVQSSSQQQYLPGMNNASTTTSSQPYQQSSRNNSVMLGLDSDISITNTRTSLGGQSSSSQGSSARRNDSEWQKVRHKQQRLLLLRHASRCKYPTGQCPVTPHCASMKKLWEHIAHCKNQQCTVPHCLSSRYVLSHYRRCKDPKCPACAPVRETIRKSNENEQPTPIGPDSGSSSNYLQPAKRKKIDHDSNHFSASVAKSSVPDTAKSKITEDGSLLKSFTAEQLTTHLESLNRSAELSPAKLKQKCSEVLKGLQTHQHGWVFNSPVDPVELGLPDYFEVIKKPMDLGTTHKKLDNGAYHSIEAFSKDVNLTFDNAMSYNDEGTVVYDMAKELKTKFEADYKNLVKELEQEDRERRQNERACVLCGCEKRVFEPPVFFCNGMSCQSQRIRRNSHFYVGGNNQYFWCNQCYNDLDEKKQIEFVDFTAKKADLLRKKNDEVHEESWVQCDVCERWIHQICGLFNTRQNKEHHSEYCCPLCLLDQRKKTPSIVPPQKPPGAAELPRTKLSEYLETEVTRRIEAKKRKVAEEKSKTGNLSMEDALKKVEDGGPVIIRQVTSMDRKHEVREYMKKRYQHKNYPDEFPFRCKCIVVFQHIDGVDVVLFALYLYEHGEDNPAPNKRCVYISYLDSVHFMRPRRMRTFVYHELLIAYLDYARQRGFATAHIWACPPLKGDDYIFYAKPEDQKTPRDSRLRQWYIDMLVECQNRNVVGKVTNMYDLYFANESLDATVVPYLEGDYFPGEAENIIKDLEEGNGKKGGSGGKKNKKKNQSKAKNRGGTRSTGVDEEALLASGMMDGVKSLKDLDRDQVMVKLGETIQPMKESFIVAFLNWSEAKKEDMEVPESVLKYREEHPEELMPLTKDSQPEPESKKRDADGEKRESSGPVDASGRPIKVIDDDTEDLDCEFLNNRQAFLNLCRGNHYQFDELRRAKHTSMMVLWHLHNRNEPKFVQQCVHCGNDILRGKRYHCDTCPDYDLCETCYRNPNTNRGACTHILKPIAVESDNGQDGQLSGLNAAQRKQRQRNLLLHIQLIEHASRCTSKACSSSNCQKMKGYLMHAKSCKLKWQGGCVTCKRIWTLLRLHAQKCKDTVCPIPQCMAIRKKMRELKKQQQAMDDRRRQEMNRHYRMGLAGAATH